MQWISVFFGAFVLLGVGCNNQRVVSRESHPRSGTAPTQSAKRLTTAHRVYPYSLIPGGVESAEELAAYRAVDPVLAQHYRGLGKALRLEQLSSDRMLYASYRINNDVFWTRKPLVIHAGETVLADGPELVRARCGNRLSATPRLPVHRFEPPVLTTEKHEVIITEVTPPEIPFVVAPTPNLPGFPLVTPPVLTPPRLTFIPPEVPPVPRTSVYPVPAPTPPLVLPPASGPPAIYTPEISTWLLMLVGMGLCGVLALFRQNWLRALHKSGKTGTNT